MIMRAMPAYLFALAGCVLLWTAMTETLVPAGDGLWLIATTYGDRVLRVCLGCIGGGLIVGALAMARQVEVTADAS